jgi:hypothetical protein
MQERCYYCNTVLIKFCSCKHRLVPHNARSKDHVTPLCRGGGRKVTCCTGCNNDKGRLTLEEYRVVWAFRNGMVPVSNFRFPGEK